MPVNGDAAKRDMWPRRIVDWQHFLGRFSQRVSPANLNSTELM